MSASAVEISHECVEVIDLLVLEPVQYRADRIDPDDLGKAVSQLRVGERTACPERCDLLVEWHGDVRRR
jgi:hypothetical protein